MTNSDVTTKRSTPCSELTNRSDMKSSPTESAEIRPVPERGGIREEIWRIASGEISESASLTGIRLSALRILLDSSLEEGDDPADPSEFLDRLTNSEI